MLIIDSQVHVWGPSTPQRPWVAGSEALADRPAYSVGELAQDMRLAGVDAAVLVPPGAWEGYWNDIVLEAGSRQPGQFAAMVNIDPMAPGMREALPTLLDHPATRGIRLGLSQGARREAFARGELEWLWQALAERQLPTAIFVPGLLDETEQMARRHPALPLALCHMSMNTRRLNPDIDGIVARLVRLAALPNVSVKASGVPLQSAQAFPFTDMHRPLERVLQAFGPERVFWGTDHTRFAHHSNHGATYEQARRLFTEELPFLSGAALELVMGRALQAWLRWPEAGTCCTAPTPSIPTATAPMQETT